jgi:hypothetical protein
MGDLLEEISHVGRTHISAVMHILVHAGPPFRSMPAARSSTIHRDGNVRYTIIAIAFSLLSAFVGCLLSYVSLGSHAKEPINIVWGFIYGLGWYAAGLLSDPRNPWVQLFGGKSWPLLIIVSIVYAAGFVRQLQNAARAVIMVFLSTSLFVVLPRRLVIGSPLDDIPTYSKILSAVY